MIQTGYLIVALVAAAAGFLIGHLVGFARGFKLNEAVDRMVGRSAEG